MVITALFLLGFSPGIFWLWYFYKRDKWEPEPKHLVLKTFLWGLVAALASILPEIPFGGFPLFSLAIVAPIVEETAKFFAVRLTIYKHSEFDEPMDGITYSAAAALGFASIENSFYLLGNYGFPFSSLVAPEQQAHTTGILPLYIIRALFSVPGHVLFSSMWGFALGWSKFMDKKMSRTLIFNGLLFSIILHGLFNYIAAESEHGLVLLLILLALMWFLVGKRIGKALAVSPHNTTVNQKVEPVQEQSSDE